MPTVSNARDLPEPSPGTVNDKAVPVKHVEAEFARIRSRGEYMAAWDGEQIAPWLYTMLDENDNGLQNHFQGAQRLGHGKFLAISGGDWRTPMSHLFIVKMHSRKRVGPWSTNVLASTDPPTKDTIVKTIGIDSMMWHSGGCGTPAGWMCWETSWPYRSSTLNPGPYVAWQTSRCPITARWLDLVSCSST
jgi:hypothetical protein